MRCIEQAQFYFFIGAHIFNQLRTSTAPIGNFRGKFILNNPLPERLSAHRGLIDKSQAF